MNTLQRVMAYLNKLPAAISGSGGHNATLRVACECFRFGLSSSEAWEAMRWYNENRCSPPWNEKDLRHKLDDAERIVSRTGATGARAGRSYAHRTFTPPVIPIRKSDARPVCQRSAAEEESWWARAAIERGTTLKEWDSIR